MVFPYSGREVRQAHRREQGEVVGVGVGETLVDVVVIGGGQAGLACAYVLRRSGRSHVVLDAGTAPGGAWRNVWDSMTLFSPARWCSLPGWIMPGGPDTYPMRDAFLAYVEAYEARYRFPLLRPVVVARVERVPGGERLRVVTDRGVWLARVVISATGTWGAPIWPVDADDINADTDQARAEDAVVGLRRFRGEQLHTVDYRSPLPFVGRRVLVVGGRNSGVQIFADLLPYADVRWVTRRPPTYLPDDADGRVLMDHATKAWLARQQAAPGTEPDLPPPLEGDIVMVPAVREARERGQLVAQPMFRELTPDGVVWADGRHERIDAIIWCTGFGYALEHLAPLGLVDERGQVAVGELSMRAVTEPRLWLVGYGQWTGDASATIAGIGRTARSAINRIVELLDAEDAEHSEHSERVAADADAATEPGV